MAQTTKIATGDGVVQNAEKFAGDCSVFEGTDVPIQRLFDHMEKWRNLYLFLDHFPSVSPEQALDALKENAHRETSRVVHSDAEMMSGAPVFKGTRLLLRNLFDYLATGQTLDVFLDDFPSANREQAVQALHLAREVLEGIAYENASR